MIAALLFACTGSPPAPSEPPDVIIVTLDTTRADRIGAYGYKDAVTPTLDGLAAGGRRYERAYSPYPLTIPAHAGMFTGMYPPHLGIRDNGTGAVEDRFSTLAERFHDAGYTTCGSVAAFVTTHQWGFQQGFDAFFDTIETESGENFWHASRPGEAVVDDALAWWNAQDSGKPRFLWVHLYDAHYPYHADESYMDRTGGRPYDAALAYLDGQVKRLVDASAGHPTLFVAIGDHGEGLGDHGELMHGLFVYDATQQVPFIVNGPGVEVAAVDEPVSTIDLFPTILSLAGLVVPADQDGMPLDGKVVPDGAPRPLYAESWQLPSRFGFAPHLAVIDGRDKLIDLPRPELYDVVADPGEETDLSGDPARADRIAALSAALDGFGFAAPTSDPAHGADPEVAEALAALGYVQGSYEADPSKAPVDPKDGKRVIGLSQRADKLEIENQLEEAEQVYATLIAENPDINEFRTRRAHLLTRLGRVDEALVQAQEALDADPQSGSGMSTVASLLARTGRYDEAAELYEKAYAVAPYDAGIRRSWLAALMSSTGGPESAVDQGLVLAKAWPDDDRLAGFVGIAYFRSGREDLAGSWLERGMKAEAPDRDVAFFLAQDAMALKDFPRANRMFQSEIERYPGNEPCVQMYAGIIVQAQDWDNMEWLGERLVKAFPTHWQAWHTLAQARFNQKDYPGAREALNRGLERFPDNADLMLLDANLLSKEGKKDEAQARYEESKAAKAAQKEVP